MATGRELCLAPNAGVESLTLQFAGGAFKLIFFVYSSLSVEMPIHGAGIIGNAHIFQYWCV